MRRFDSKALLGHVFTATVVSGGMVALTLQAPRAPDALILPFILLGFVWVAFRMRRYLRRSLGRVPPAPEVLAHVRRMPFFKRFMPSEQALFERNVTWFVHEQRIRGVGVEVDDELRAAVAAGACLVCFGLPDHEWPSERSVVIVPTALDDDLNPSDDGELLGVFQEQGPILFSAPDLRSAFAEEDGLNVAVHEFAHHLDFDSDREITGVPAHLNRHVADLWADSISAHLSGSRRNRRLQRVLDVDAYRDGGELFAHLTELFFELPDVLQEIAPKLYALLTALYHQDPATRIRDDERMTYNDMFGRR
jgi:Mlc titration factor MtfA (ptsG expression regulator)